MGFSTSSTGQTQPPQEEILKILQSAQISRAIAVHFFHIRVFLSSPTERDFKPNTEEAVTIYKVAWSEL